MSNGYSSAGAGRSADLGPGAEALGPPRSGRRFVIVAVVAIAALWGTLFLVFRDWRTRHRDLAAFGAREVATLVDPLAGRVPATVEPKAWRAAVADTHAMLETLTASGLLDRAAMEGLRDDLRERFATTTPETAAADLSRLWDEMQAKAGPVLAGRSSRPPYPPSRPKVLGGK